MAGVASTTERRKFFMLYKRSNSKFWWCKFTAPNGQRVRKSTKTVDKRLAQEFEDKYRASLWRIIQLGERPRRTWKEAVLRWHMESQDKKTIDDDLAHIRWLDPYLGDLYLDEVIRDRIDSVTTAKLNTGVKPATVNRMLEVIRAILNRAFREWEWLEKVPYVRMLKEPKRRIRWLHTDEVQRLLLYLPPHLSAMVRFSLATGLRESNVTRLEWSQVDLSRRMAWIHADQAKAGRPIGIPLNNEAVILLRQQQGNHTIFVFTYKGRPIKKANTKAWREALKKAEIENFRWHDLRHTWASWHIQNGTPIHILQEMGGWSDIKMVQR
ncbi:MAG TPA: site-specific integrase, partial [Methylophaga aminisulfidivorans]|nr:site-specific integrase [Methylophaga aminisulfidivorans]